jgi:hypothetical protein
MLGVLASAGGLARLIAPIAATIIFQEVGVGAPLIIGGALVLLAVLDALHADAYVASERDILHGLALGLAA